MAAKDSETLSEQPETPFHDLDHYLAIPRVSGLALSPDGARLVTTVATLDAKGTEYCTALWEVDPGGAKQARRITRSAKGEAGAVFAANGDLYFTSARPDPESPEADPVNALWMLPADGGEARVALSRAGGIGGVTPPRTPTPWWSRPRSWPAPRTRTMTRNAARPARTTRSRPSCTAATLSATGTRTWARRSRGCSPSNPETSWRPESRPPSTPRRR